jgi:pilus assembly protein CpaF
LGDDSISEIMVLGPERTYIERKGLLQLTPMTFRDEAHLRKIIDRIVTPLGRHVDAESPTVLARLPGGSRVHVAIPPATTQTMLNIRLFPKKPFQVEDLIRFGSWIPEVAEFLRAVTIAGLNVIVSGGPGSGKTTLLNVLSGFIPADARLVSVENAAELQLHQEHVLTLETRPPDAQGQGAVGYRDLLHQALDLSPDRLILEQVGPAEVAEILEVMNLRDPPVMMALTSANPADTLARLETMALMHNGALPGDMIRQRIATGVDLIVHMGRLRDGTRRLVRVTEMRGLKDNQFQLADIFVFEQTGVEKYIIGRIRATGKIPRWMDRLEMAGAFLPPRVFGAGAQWTDQSDKHSLRQQFSEFIAYYGEKWLDPKYGDEDWEATRRDR